MSEQSPIDPHPSQKLTGKQTYNVVTDIATGANLRSRDNLYQALAIFVCLILGAAIGYFSVRDQALGAFAGGFAGLLVGLFGSGLFLMIFRAAMHMRGKHE